MAYANGRLPASALSPIPGNGQLRNDAARAYRAMAILASRRGVSMVIIEGAVRRTYRPIAAQYLAKRIYGSNAATPGTSNHGWALAIDLMNMAQRRMIDKIGRAFGFAKAWSDASWEWWHIKWRAGTYAAVAKVKRYPRNLKAGSSGKTVGKLNYLLRGKGFKSIPAHGKKGHDYFGRKTKSAVKRFQKAHHLTADGVVGPSTWQALGVRPK